MLKILQLAMLVMLLPGFASAATVWTFNRIDDSTASLSGTGSLDSFVSDGTTIDLLFFQGASATSGNPGSDSLSGDLALGGLSSQGAFIGFRSRNLLVAFPLGLGAGDIPTGSALITLNVETWAAIGTTGNVTDEGGNGVGTYSIVAAVPLPAGGVLLISGLGAFAFLRRRKR